MVTHHLPLLRRDRSHHLGQLRHGHLGSCTLQELLIIDDTLGSLIYGESLSVSHLWALALLLLMLSHPILLSGVLLRIPLEQVAGQPCVSEDTINISFLDGEPLTEDWKAHICCYHVAAIGKLYERRIPQTVA